MMEFLRHMLPPWPVILAIFIVLCLFVTIIILQVTKEPNPTQQVSTSNLQSNTLPNTYAH
jgi:hypothetical protein